MERKSNRGRPVTGRPRTRSSLASLPSDDGDKLIGDGESNDGLTTATADFEDGYDDVRSCDLIPFVQFSPTDEFYVLADEIPTTSEEVVLNKCGMPVRQRKRNSLYFCDEMLTSKTTGGSKTTTAAVAGKDAKKVKSEVDKVVASAPVTPEKDGGREELEEVPARITNTARRGRPLTTNTRRFSGGVATPPSIQIKINAVSTTPQVASNPQVLELKEDRWSRLAEVAGSSKAEWINEEETVEKKVELSFSDMIKVDQRRRDSVSSTPTKQVAVVAQQQQPMKEKVAAGSPRKQPRPSRARRPPSTLKPKLEKVSPPKHTKVQSVNVPIRPALVANLASSVAVSVPTPPKRVSTVGAPLRFLAPGPVLAYHQLQTQGPPPQELMVENQRNKELNEMSLRVRNFLKLPKSHKWVCYEWFYSSIYQVLFHGENDFQMCLRESFPSLRTRMMNRVEWTFIRRMMGKPRRCSSVFFTEERQELYQKRQKIREIQQRKVSDFNYKELPDEIPLQFVIGTNVTARLRAPQDGIFEGTIEGADTSNNTYRIAFHRQGVGSHSVPDFEVCSNEPLETVSTSSFALKIPRRIGGCGELTVGNFKFQNPSLLALKPEGFPDSPFDPTAMLGGFPIRLLNMIVQLSKQLKLKRKKIAELRELNVKAEKMISYGKPFDQAYRLEYARCVQSLDSLNKTMDLFMAGIQAYCVEISCDPQPGSNSSASNSTSQPPPRMINSEQVLESCKEEAAMIVSNFNDKGEGGQPVVRNPKILELIKNMTAMMLGIRSHSVSEKSPYEVKPLQEYVKKDVKATLDRM